MNSRVRFVMCAVALIALALSIGPTSAQEAPDGPTVGACAAGAGYASGCDVDQDSDIDILDVQLTAGRWNSSGAYAPDHNHWGETWTGATSDHGLRLEHTAASGSTSGIVGQSASSDGRGVYGYASAASGPTYGVRGQSDSTGGRGVFGYAAAASGTTYGVRGQSVSTSGTGVSGWASGGSGETYGVHGQSDSPSGNGVFGYATAASGFTYGVYGQSDSSSGRALYGYATAASGETYGLLAKTDSTEGRGVSGWATAASGATYGMHGTAQSTAGRGVYGSASATSGLTFGVYGTTASTSGRGVYGYATTSSGTNYGVYGVTNSASGYAGYFIGAVHVNGTLSKSAGSFKIDHPLDPANQYLSHSFVESPDMKNIYDGVAVLDANGEAAVTLPVWFEVLNRDFRYQLTPIGGWAPLYIAQEIQGNLFRIAGGQPGMKVSWQVTGIRQDAYANAHRILVEEAKPAEEAGLYLHPLELGQPAELGLDYQR